MFRPDLDLKNGIWHIQSCSTRLITYRDVQYKKKNVLKGKLCKENTEGHLIFEEGKIGD